ncbi:hypothetical protein IQ273_01065 [Nodosilinea sp. LEGE 07298]|uniref:hypothetical protein n=1 Tax=Nodosilinea sp. LEGE 07298 TaxID=2777970 RepID=UPI001880E2EB|nr:hypothetical protein [Nodosilinea sp. LEGE 07298]MBE9108015.1 hypothetical protein [Nodosilinea sp. LEGE 07298]
MLFTTERPEPFSYNFLEHVYTVHRIQLAFVGLEKVPGAVGGLPEDWTVKLAEVLPHESLKAFCLYLSEQKNLFLVVILC